MTAWKINPKGVQGVLTKVGAKNEDMSKDLDKQNFDNLSSALSNGAGGLMGEVPAAVNGLMQDQGKNFKTIGDHIQAGIVGVTDATIAYANAQAQSTDSIHKYDKAKTFQDMMLYAADTGDTSYFKEHGYDEHGHETYTPPAAKPAPRAGRPVAD